MVRDDIGSIALWNSRIEEGDRRRLPKNVNWNELELHKFCSSLVVDVIP